MVIRRAKPVNAKPVNAFAHLFLLLFFFFALLASLVYSFYTFSFHHVTPIHVLYLNYTSLQPPSLVFPFVTIIPFCHSVAIYCLITAVGLCVNFYRRNQVPKLISRHVYDHLFYGLASYHRPDVRTYFLFFHHILPTVLVSSRFVPSKLISISLSSSSLSTLHRHPVRVFALNHIRCPLSTLWPPLPPFPPLHRSTKLSNSPYIFTLHQFLTFLLPFSLTVPPFYLN